MIVSGEGDLCECDEIVPVRLRKVFRDTSSDWAAIGDQVSDVTDPLFTATKDDIEDKVTSN